MDEVVRVVYRWDESSGCESGWYAEAWSSEDLVCDSQKIWFPVNLDPYEEDDSKSVARALSRAFPDAIVEEEGNDW